MHTRVGEEQMLERSVGQVHADPRNAGSDRRSNVAARAGAGKHDGTRRGFEQRSFLIIQFTEGASGGEIAHHHREWFAVAVFALAEAHHCGFVGRVYSEVESADALYGHDAAGEQILDTVRDWILGL